MKPIVEVTYLANNHGSTLGKCPGCKICNRIAELMNDVDVDPNEKYKWLLDKGEDLTVSEIIYLNGKDVLKSNIQQATGLTKKELNELLLKGESLDKKSIKAVETMGNLTMTFAEYKDLKAEGKTNKEIANIAGIKEGNLNYQIKKWKEQTEQPKQAANEEYNNLIAQLKEQVEQKDGTIEKLEKKIEKLEQDKLDLHAAADDMAREYLEKEEKLLIDLSLWEQQALTFKTENKRLNDTLKDVRQGADKHKGDAILFRSVLKAVL